jgi:hypothetical protein
MAPEARLAEAGGSVSGRDTVLSPDGRWRAFVLESLDEPGGRIRLEELRGRRGYELRGLPLPYRPLTALVWLDGRLLAFDRWSQPHYGLHYVLDVRARRLLLAVPFPDEFFLQRQARPDTGPHRRL